MFRITSALSDKIHHFASFPQTGVSLHQMVLFGQNPSQGTLLKASQFVAEELPIRLAHRVKELDELPHRLSEMPSIQRVKEWYAQSFEELITFPPPRLSPSVRQALFTPSLTPLPTTVPNPSLHPNYPPDLLSIPTLDPAPTQQPLAFNRLRLRVPMERRYYANVDGEWPPEVPEYNRNFRKLLEKIKSRHDPTVATVAQGVLEWKQQANTRHIALDIQAFLDRFYMSRIGIRFLIGQHIALTSPHPPIPTGDPPTYVGIICTNANIHDILLEAIENARFVCEDHYAMFRAPPVQLICPPDLTFAYVPGHLSHIVFELLKNSLRAVVERYASADEYGLRDCDDIEFPPIKLIVVEGTEDITIKISDEGGGIARSAIPLIWTYLYTTTSPQSVEQGSGQFTGSDFKAPMAGFGYGLPLSRLYARYFGGDLRLISMDGFGTDVYIHLNRLSSSAEPLP